MDFKKVYSLTYLTSIRLLVLACYSSMSCNSNLKCCWHNTSTQNNRTQGSKTWLKQTSWYRINYRSVSFHLWNLITKSMKVQCREIWERLCLLCSLCRLLMRTKQQRILVIKVIPDPEGPGTLMFGAPTLHSIRADLQMDTEENHY